MEMCIRYTLTIYAPQCQDIDSLFKCIMCVQVFSERYIPVIERQNVKMNEEFRRIEVRPGNDPLNIYLKFIAFYRLVLNHCWRHRRTSSCHCFSIAREQLTCGTLTSQR